MQNKIDRRRFLTQSTAMMGITLGGIKTVSGQSASGASSDVLAYGERSKYVSSRRIPDIDETHRAFGRHEGMLTPLQDSMGIITPNSLHFATMHGYYPPDINPDEHKLIIHGMVDRPLVFTMDELMRLPSVSRIHYLECQANRPEVMEPTVQGSHGKTSCAEWTGVLLSTLLQEAGVKANSEWVIYEGAEAGKMTKSLPMKKAMADVIIAYGQNGEPIRPQNGYPLRMLVPGFEALYSIKWLRRIKVVDRPYMGYQEIRQYTNRAGREYDERTPFYNFENGPKSVITSPSGEQKLTSGPGYYRITGLAWSGGGRIRKVEVSTDSGKTWHEAAVEGPAHTMAHTRFNYIWQWQGEETHIMSRSTDEQNQVQPSRQQFARYWNIDPDKLAAGEQRGSGHHNSIQPWGIRRDGSVYNSYPLV
jgi:sulfane dehydrogenase subunit SoxC